MAAGSPNDRLGESQRRRKRIADALIILALKVARRSGEDEQIEARIEQYAADLSAWPERVALACLAEHPKRSIYWPAWKELEDLRRELEPKPTAHARGLPEHRLLPPAGAKSQGQEPFTRRQDWDDLQEALRKLRDPSVPMLAREGLLKIGERIEARQRPNAEARGWLP